MKNASDNKKKDMTCQNMRDTAQAVLRANFTALRCMFKKWAVVTGLTRGPALLSVPFLSALPIIRNTC